MWLVTLVKFRYKNCSQRRAFPLPCCPRAGIEGFNDVRTAISSENIQLLQSYIAIYRKKLEEVVFVEEEFLYKKISKKDVYMWIMVPRLISHKLQLSSMEILQH